MYLAIDLWNKRAGIAKSQESIAFTMQTVPRTEVISFIQKALQDFQEIHTIVVGLPYDLYGKDTLQLERTQKFIEKMKRIFPELKIVGHDERFSSFVADEGSMSHDDSVAAQVILQSYLDTIKK